VSVGTLMAPVRNRVQALNAFKLVDANNDDFMNQFECVIPVAPFMAQVEKFSGHKLTSLFKDLDVDNNNFLTPDEFSNIAELINERGAKHQYTIESTIPVLVELDGNGDGQLSKGEFTGMSEGLPLSKSDISAYFDVPATVQGHAEVKLYIPREAKMPKGASTTQIDDIIKPIFETAFNKAFGATVVVESIQTTGAEAVQDATQASKDDDQQRQAVISWTVQTKNSGKFMQDVMGQSGEFQNMVSDGLRSSSATYLQASNALVWSRMSYACYGKAAMTAPRGTDILQQTGQKPGQETKRGSSPYTHGGGTAAVPTSAPPITDPTATASS